MNGLGFAGRLFSRSRPDSATSRSVRPAPGDEWLSTVTSLGYGHSGIASLFAVLVHKQGAEMSASGRHTRDA
ncbi:MAG: hypothetical protein QOH73_346 [Gaiellaceae bacterium]|jgi:hypothetical protein|nr:hypothetical protein [Gaiellaceae bacterium]